MPNTRKKVIKTVYKNEDSEEETGDFSDSGSEAQISEPPSSEEDDIEENASSAEEFSSKSGKNCTKQPIKRKPKFAKEFINKITKQINTETEENEAILPQFDVKDLTDADKLLPSVLNLSESDSSDDESPMVPHKKTLAPCPILEKSDSENDDKGEYTDVWANNSAEVAKEAFMELEKHKNTIEETKASLQSYVPRTSMERTKESNITDLLALGEDVAPQKSPVPKKRKGRKFKEDSGSELEDWEEVKESKPIPQQGLQLIVELPDFVCRKSKKIDVEMMMKRKMNRVKKENQVFMHKVHVLCWLGHGNYVSPILNNREIMAAVLAMVPKGCYPNTRLDMKYAEQITEWYKDKLTFKQDKNENKFRPKAPPLKNILLDQIKSRVVTAKKYKVFIFVAMLRALGLQCRVMFNFVTVPLKPSSSELCSLSTKNKDSDIKKEEPLKAPMRKTSGNKAKAKAKIPQVDGMCDSFSSFDSEFEDTMEISDCESYSEYKNIMQVDGNDDALATKTRTVRATRAKKSEETKSTAITQEEDDVSPPKRSKRNPPQIKSVSKLEPDKNNPKQTQVESNKKLENSKSPQRKTKNNVQENSQNDLPTTQNKDMKTAKSPKSLSLKRPEKSTVPSENSDSINEISEKVVSPRKTRNNNKTNTQTKQSSALMKTTKTTLESTKIMPKITLTDEKGDETTPSKYFQEPEKRTSRKRSNTAGVKETKDAEIKVKESKSKTRAKSASSTEAKSKYFGDSESKIKIRKLTAQQLKKQEKLEDAQRVSHKDLIKLKAKPKNDVTGDLVNIIKSRIKIEKEEAKNGKVKGKIKVESDEDSDYLPVEDPKHCPSESDEEFKPANISAKASKLSPGVKPSTSKKKLDRRVVSPDDSNDGINKVDVWCEVFVEELEQWVAIDVIKGKVHCTGDLYSHATHPVCYVIGWDNNNYLKDLTRRYVPHWNTVTRKQRAEAEWWRAAVQPCLGPRSARDREEDDALHRMQLEAPLPKSIAEYKNHPLYALKRHLLKFEAIYPPDAQTLGFVRNEAVYARECVYVCRSRDTWLKEAKVVKMGELPYKVVKARPKWDKLSNKLITDKPLEVFGPWQVQDYEPPTAENGIVPRNAYGNVELFKECMLPKGTVHIKLPGLNKVARKLNIDCAPAMTGFDFNGGWSHPVYDGFVVCKEFEEIITDAWIKDQEEQERKEREKVELRVYGNWKRLIKGLLIRERLKYKYGFEEPTASQPAKKKGPRFVAKKN